VVHETRFHTAGGRLLDVRVTTSAVRATATPSPHLIMHLEDVSDREDLRRRLQHEATHDPLTGLGNRARFLDELRRALPRAERHEQPVTVLYLDLDGFKEVNDTHGHAVGDEVLVAFGRHVRESVRPEDTAARLGGDEFAVLCEDTTAEQAALVVERLTSGSWAQCAADVATGLTVGVTVGAATSGGGGGPRVGAEQLLQDADAAMYEAKARRRR
jgi:diguanylate cyclase (GGDEF)-like protein